MVFQTRKTKTKVLSKKESSERKPGGQLDHKGTTGEMFANPDEVVELDLNKCPHCGCDELFEVRTEVRQVIEILLVKAKVTEYRRQICECTYCKLQIKGEFPENVKARMQLGSRMKGLIGYLKVQNNLSHEKIVTIQVIF